MDKAVEDSVSTAVDVDVFEDESLQDCVTHKHCCAGGSAGFVGSLFGNPAEVALIRMCADGNLPASERRGYTSAFNALSRIV